MAPPLAPVDASAAKWAPDTLQSGDVDAQAPQMPPPGRRQLQAIAGLA